MALISDVIAEMQEFMEEHGDLPVTFSDGNQALTEYSYVDLRKRGFYVDVLPEDRWMCQIRHGGRIYTGEQS